MLSHEVEEVYKHSDARFNFSYGNAMLWPNTKSLFLILDHKLQYTLGVIKQLMKQLPHHIKLMTAHVAQGELLLSEEATATVCRL